jgi:hypothetical protein
MSGYIGTQPVPQATQTRQTFVATAAQTSFATGGYQAGYLDVFLNGVKLQDGVDYTATNGSDIVLTVGAALDDTLEVVAYTAFEVLDQTFTGTTTVTDSGAAPLVANRTTSDGDITLFQKDGSTVGSIGNHGGSGIYLDAPSTIRFSQSGGAGGNTRTLRFANYSGGGAGYFGPNNDANSDAGISLGTGDGRWNDLYLSGGVYLGGTGAANKLDDVEEGTFTPSIYSGPTGITYTLQDGYYYKVGSIVFIRFILGFACTGGAGAGVKLTGLPYLQNVSGSSWLAAGSFGGSFNTFTGARAAAIEGTNNIFRAANDSTLSTTGSGKSIEGTFLYATNS